MLYTLGGPGNEGKEGGTDGQTRGPVRSTLGKYRRHLLLLSYIRRGTFSMSPSFPPSCPARVQSM